MKVSIIIPVYNGEQFIEDCIRSAIAQNLDLVEIICINDGSTDDTQKILGVLESEFSILHVINKSNEGPAKARETGALKATGEYLVFLDGDDLLAPNSLCSVYDAANKHNLDMAVYGYVTFYDEPKFCESNREQLDSISIYSGKEYINRFMYTAYNWDKLWRRDFYINNVMSGGGGFYYEDQLPILKGISSSVRIAKLDIQCVGYRDNVNSTTRRAVTVEHFQDLRSVIVNYSKVLKDNDLLYSRCALMKLAHMLALLDAHRSQLGLEFDKEILSVYEETRGYVISKNDGMINLCRKIGVIYGLYYKLDTPCLGGVQKLVGKVSKVRKIIKRNFLWLEKGRS